MRHKIAHAVITGAISLSPLFFANSIKAGESVTISADCENSPFSEQRPPPGSITISHYSQVSEHLQRLNDSDVNQIKSHIRQLRSAAGNTRYIETLLDSAYQRWSDIDLNGLLE